MTEKKNGIDTLTSCRLHDGFEKETELLLRDADEQYFFVSLVMLDIDNFKRVNDQLGRKAGDEVLTKVSKVLREIGNGSLSYRYSGDEFAVVLPKKEKEEVFLLMEKVRESIGDSLKEFNVTVSAGIATYPDDGARLADIVRKAEGALYRAKTSGRNKICLAKDEKLVTKTVHFSVEQLQRLKLLSENTGIGEAALMREALEELLKKYDARNRHKPTVLIVEDSEFMRKTLSEMLTRRGLAVEGEADDGEKGAMLFSTINPDYVILDIMMEGKDGIWFLNNIKKNQKNNIITLTSSDSKEIFMDAIRYGTDAYIMKPFQPDYLLNVIDNIDNYRFKPEYLTMIEKELSELSDMVPLHQEIIDKILISAKQQG